MMRSGAFASLLLVVALVGPADGLQPKSRSARRMAERDPCQLLRAIFDANAGASAWSISIQPECCKTKQPRIEPRPTVLTLGDDELIGWERSCGAGVGGPHRRPSTLVEYYFIGLDVKDRSTLRFDVTPGHTMFDRAGREGMSSIQGCSSFRGEARLLDAAAR
jgi:hypothetical protein